MGRRMLPLDPRVGPVARFACELRALRSAAGEVAFWKLARRCQVSKSALAQAVAGRELPSDRVARAFVTVCGGDWGWWGERLAQARAELAEGLAASTAEARTGTGDAHAQLVLRPRGALALPSKGEAVPRRPGIAAVWGDDPDGWPRRPDRRRRGLVRVLAVLAVAEAVVLVLIVGPLRSPSRGGTRARAAAAASEHPASRTARAEPAAAAAGRLPVRDGNDPYLAGCGADQSVVQKVAMSWPNGRPYGTLTLYHSISCNASWGSVSGPNSAAWTVYIVAHRPTDGLAAPSQFSGYSVKSGSWGNMLLTSRGCVWVEAYVVEGAQRSKSAESFCYEQSGPLVDDASSGASTPTTR